MEYPCNHSTFGYCLNSTYWGKVIEGKPNYTIFSGNITVSDRNWKGFVAINIHNKTGLWINEIKLVHCIAVHYSDHLTRTTFGIWQCDSIFTLWSELFLNKFCETLENLQNLSNIFYQKKYSNELSLVLETQLLPLCQRNTGDRKNKKNSV